MNQDCQRKDKFKKSNDDPNKSIGKEEIQTLHFTNSGKEVSSLILIKERKGKPEDFMKEVFLHESQSFLAEGPKKIAGEKGKDKLYYLYTEEKQNDEI